MSEETGLSQDELGALLGDVAPEDGGNATGGTTTTIDDFKKLLSGCVTSLNTALAQGLGEEVSLSLGDVELTTGISIDGVAECYVGMGSFTNNGPANAIMVLSTEVAHQMAIQQSGVQDLENKEEEIVGPLGELYNKFITEEANEFSKGFSASLETFQLENDLMQIESDTAFIKVSWLLGENVFYQFFQNNILQYLSDANNTGSGGGLFGGGASDESSGGGGLFGNLNDESGDSLSLGDALLGANTVSDVEMPSFDNYASGSGESTSNSIKLLMDVSMEVTVELGKTKKMVGEILDLNRGSIIELKKLAGEPLDIKVNNKLIARGEVVVIDEYFGVRIIEIVSPYERS